MAKIVQIAGGESTTEDFYIGPERELRADTSNDELRLHDGTKVGGFRFLNMDQSDARYQERSIELDGFSFGAQSKGILVRVSPSNYALRAIEVNAENMTITNPRGTLGNLTFSLSPTITSDHTFTGTITTTLPLIGTGGFIGNLTGDVAGNVTGNLVGNVTGNLTGDANGDHTGTFTGSLDTTLGAVIMANGQIQLPWLSAAIQQLWIDRGVPQGAILMWSGSIETIPPGWLLCNGTSGTPDLTDRFIIGAGDSFAPLVVGGAENHLHVATAATGGSHGHTATIGTHALTEAEMPAHKHLNGVTHNDSSIYNHGTEGAVPSTSRRIDGNGGSGTIEGYTTTIGSGAPHTHEGSITSVDAGHVHSVTVATASNIPPYYALCFIMKGV